MKSFFSARRTRYTAAVMLFVWLMSLGIGVANACLVQQDHGPREYFSHSRSGTDLTALPERQAARDNFATISVHSDENAFSPDKITCQDFCVAQQSTLVTDHLNGLPQLDLAPVLYLTGLLVPATDQMSASEASESPIWSKRPVAIRYLRLII